VLGTFPEGFDFSLVGGVEELSFIANMMNFAARRISGSARALTITSGPMPAGSPIVMPMAGWALIELLPLILFIIANGVLRFTPYKFRSLIFSGVRRYYIGFDIDGIAGFCCAEGCFV